ncbi:MAG: ABC transporter substrate-binding protein, partial [Candidatus Heimdallarchaeota archaeon]|nr:ABC transporter substrate-binding protein [Candidatus Heimdallarchaeota archaeon]
YPTIGFSLNIQDTGSNTVVAQTASNALVANGVHGVVGPALSSNLLQVAQTFIDNQIPLISYSATSPDISGLNDSGLIFRTSPNDAIQGSILAEIAKIAGSMNVSTIAINDSFGIGIIDRFTANFTGSTQLSMVYNSGSTNFQTLVASILGGNPDTIVLVADLTNGAAILNELSNQNFTGLILASEEMQNLFITDHPLVGPEILDGILGPTLTINPESTFNIRFNTTYGIDTHFFASFAYDAVMMMGDAIAHFNTLDGLQIANSLREIGNNAIGASGLITFDDNGDNIHVAYDILQYQIIPTENRHDFVGVWEPISMSVNYFANVQKTKWPGLIQGTNITTLVTSTAPVTSTSPSTTTTSSTSTSSMETSTSTPSTDDDTTTSIETTTIDDTTSTSGPPSLPGFTLALSIISFSTAFVILRRKNIR